jgi:hypothetical protein
VSMPNRSQGLMLTARMKPRESVYRHTQYRPRLSLGGRYGSHGATLSLDPKRLSTGFKFILPRHTGMVCMVTSLLILWSMKDWLV